MRSLNMHRDDVLCNDRIARGLHIRLRIFTPNDDTAYSWIGLLLFFLCSLWSNKKSPSSDAFHVGRVFWPHSICLGLRNCASFSSHFLWLLLVHCLLGMYSSAMWVLVSGSIRFMSRICVFGRSVLVLACNEFDRWTTENRTTTAKSRCFCLICISLSAWPFLLHQPYDGDRRETTRIIKPEWTRREERALHSASGVLSFAPSECDCNC